MKDFIDTEPPEQSFVLTAVIGVSGFAAAVLTFFTNGGLFLFCFAASLVCILVASYQLFQAEWENWKKRKILQSSLSSVPPKTTCKLLFFNSLSVREIDVALTGDAHNVLVADTGKGQVLRAFAVEFILDSASGFEDSVAVEAYVKAGDQQLRRAGWLKSSGNDASISDNESDFLILAVKGRDEAHQTATLHQYHKQPRYVEKERIICGNFFPIDGQCLFQVEYFCLRERSLIGSGVIEFNLPEPKG